MTKEIFNEAFDKTRRMIESVEQIVQMQVCVPDLVLTNCEDEPPPMEVNEQAAEEEKPKKDEVKHFTIKSTRSSTSF